MAKSSFVPQYQLIYDSLKTQIQSGAYEPGSQLPYERELCETYGVQRITVRKALDMLVRDELICKRPGLGSFVQSAPAQAGARSLTGTILFVMHKSQNDIRSNSSAYNARLFFLMERLCRDEGFTLLYAGITEEGELCGLIEQYQAVGVFLVSTIPRAIIDCLHGMRIPAICLNHFDERLLSVLPDNHTGIRGAVLRLASLGHRRIAYIGGAKDSYNARERLQAFISAMNERGLPAEFVLEGHWTHESGINAVRGLLEGLARDRYPTALIAASDMMAIGAIEAVAQAGLSIPGNLSVIGFDRIDLCRYCSPHLTSVGPDAQQMAAVAVEHMRSMLYRAPSPNDRYIVRLPVSFNDGASIAPPR